MSSCSNDFHAGINDLRLTVDGEATAVIKATSVMIMVD